MGQRKLGRGAGGEERKLYSEHDPGFLRKGRKWGFHSPGAWAQNSLLQLDGVISSHYLSMLYSWTVSWWHGVWFCLEAPSTIHTMHRCSRACNRSSKLTRMCALNYNEFSLVVHCIYRGFVCLVFVSESITSFHSTINRLLHGQNNLEPFFGSFF